MGNGIVEKIVGKKAISLVEKKKGQTSGQEFEIACAEFIENTFLKLETLRPGKWYVEQVKSRKNNHILGGFEQYHHLSELEELSSKYDELKNFLGEGYTVSPDIIVSREPEDDSKINENRIMVDDSTTHMAMLRKVNHSSDGTFSPLLHASISCKFTMRSDRAQNTRTEALNLLRSRKGRAPHIVAVTAEPMPSRIASLALGTGDMDCVYHFALYELGAVLEEQGFDDALDLLNIMVRGKRLKDISDLPLDLAV